MRGRLRLRARQGGVQLARLWEAAPAAHGSRARCYRHLGSQWGTWGDHSSPSGLRFAMEWLQILQGKCKFHVLGGYENIGLGEAKSWCRRLCESQGWGAMGHRSRLCSFQLLPVAPGSSRHEDGSPVSPLVPLIIPSCQGHGFFPAKVTAHLLNAVHPQ